MILRLKRAAVAMAAPVRSQAAFPLDLPPAGRSRLDAVIEVLLTVLLVFSPLALGVVEAWSELVVIALSGIVALCLALKFALRANDGPVFSWAYLPLLLFLAAAVIQLVPLPGAVLSVLSPGTVATKNELLADVAGTAGGLGSMPISFYPGGTLHDLRLALAVAAVFFAAAHVYRRPEAIRRLLIVLAVSGAAIALLAIAQVLTGTGRIYWSYTPSQGSGQVVRGGPFVNRNNFCLFMNLSLGASLGLLLLAIHDGLRGVRKTLPAVLDWLGSPPARWLWALVGTIVLGMASVFLSLSRGGVIALLFATTATALLMAVRRRLDGRAWVMAVLALAAFVCVLFLGFDAIYDRLATLEEQQAYAGRWGIVKGVALAWTKFPVLGAGFGTHEVVFPMFGRTTSSALFAYAENEYAQMAEEMGLVGLVLVAAFGAAILVHFRRCLRAGGWRAAIAYGLGFSLIAAAVHSVADFGLHLPANGCLAAVLCGVLVGAGSRAAATKSAAAPANPEPRMAPPAPARRGLRRAFAPVAIGAVALIWGWAVYTGNEARAAEHHWKEALRIEHRLRQQGWLGANRIYEPLIYHAAAAARLSPENVHYPYWLAVYRWRSISRVEDPGTGQIKLGPTGRTSLERIVRDLHRVRRLCPTFGPVLCVAGQLERFFLERPEGSERIRMGYRLAPSDPTVCFVAGLLDAEEGRPSESLAKFRRALELNASLYGDISGVLIHRTKQPDLALELAGDDAYRLGSLQPRLAAVPELAALADETARRWKAALIERCEAPDAPAGLLATLAGLHAKQGEHEAAATCYHRALDADYGRIGWRLALAKTYEALDRREDAIKQADICLSLRPEMAAAKALIRKLSIPGGK